MEKMAFLIFACAFALFSLTAQKNFIHMLQLNSYRPERYMRWLCENKTRFFYPRACIALLAVPFCFVSENAFLFAAAFLFVAAAPYRRKKAKKPLVYTQRVKRLFFFSAVTEIFIAAAAFFTGVNALLFAAAILSPWLTFPALYLSLPVEKAISAYYVSDAKKILASHKDLIVIGVTGSYGKTSMKYALTKLLSERYDVLMTPGSYNTPMGVVRTVRESLKSTHKIFVVEMGAKNKGDIKEICDIVNPKYGIITSVGPQHLETFGSVENVCDTKFELAEAVRLNGGTVFLNFDNEYIRNKKFDGEKVGYGTDESADFRVTDISYSAAGSEFKVNGHALSTSLLGSYSAVNIAGAYAVASKLGVTEDGIKTAVRRLKAPEHRLELKKNPRYTVIDDAYNSNPDGAAAALTALSSFPERKILVTPGMVELGEKQYELNKEFGRKAAFSADYIVLVGEKQAVPIKDGIEETDFDKEKLYVAKDINDALAFVYGITDVPSVVLLENDLPDNFL